MSLTNQQKIGGFIREVLCAISIGIVLMAFIIAAGMFISVVINWIFTF